MVKNLNQSTFYRGNQCEAHACQYLESKGYQLIEKNFRWKRGELDLVMKDPGGSLVFIEVRSASSASPWLRFSISPMKQYHLRTTIAVYLQKRICLQRFPYRFDVVWVEKGVIEHWKNVGL